MKKLNCTLICIILVTAMLFTACANKGPETSGKANDPSNQPEISTDSSPSEEKRSDVYDIAAEFQEKRASSKVTIKEVEEIISLARKVYREYDTVIVDEDTAINPVDVPEMSAQKAGSLDTSDQKLQDYERYLGETRVIAEKMLSLYFPENNILIMKGETNFPYPDYYFLDLESKGIKNAKEAFDQMLDDGTPSFDKVSDCVYVLRGNILFYNAETDESVPLLPNEEESEINRISMINR